MEELLTQIKNYSNNTRKVFENIGGQLVPKEDLQGLLDGIKADQYENWHQIHKQYHTWSSNYLEEKLVHALASLAELSNKPIAHWDIDFLTDLIEESKATQRWIYDEIYKSREKDYTNPFRKMVYENEEEMNIVVGSLADNAFINTMKEETADYLAKADHILNKINIH